MLSLRWWTSVRPLVAALAIGAAAFVLGVVATAPYVPLSDDAWIMDVARHVAQGHGFTTSVTMPLYLEVTSGAPIDRNPHFQAPAGYPHLVAVAFRVGGESVGSAVALQGVILLVLLAATYAAARAFVGPGWASLATMVVALDAKIQLYAHLTSPDLAFAAAVATACAVLLHTNAVSGRLAVAGAIIAVSQLFRFNAAALLPAFLALVALRRPTAQAALRPMAVVGLAWLVVVIAVITISGSGRAGPVAAIASALIETDRFPGWSIQGAVRAPTAAEVLSNDVGSIVRKVLAGLRFFAAELPRVGNPLIVGGAFLAAVLLATARAARPFVVFVATATGTTIVVASAVEHGLFLLLFMVPFYVLLVVVALERHGVARRIAATALIGIALVSFTGETLRSVRDVENRRAMATEVGELATLLRDSSTPGDWIATDMPALVAWHATLPAIRLPDAPDGLSAIAEKRRPVTRIVLTNINLSSDRIYPDASWRRVRDGAPLDGFAVEQVFVRRHIEAIVLRRTASSARSYERSSSNEK